MSWFAVWAYTPGDWNESKLFDTKAEAAAVLETLDESEALVLFDVVQQESTAGDRSER